MTTLSLLVALGWLTGAPPPSAAATPTKVEVRLHVNGSRFAVDEVVELTVAVENRWLDDIYLYGELDWGFFGGFELDLATPSGDPVEPEVWDHVPVPALKAVEDKTAYVRLAPGHFLGRARAIRAGSLVPRPGKYLLRVVYHAPVFRSNCPRRPCWAREDGPVVSPPVEFEVVEPEAPARPRPEGAVPIGVGRLAK